MDVSDITWFLLELGCDKIKTGSKAVSATCPLAYFTHAKMADNTPSFAVSIVPGSTSGYKCLACGHRGTLPSLVWKLTKYKNQDLSHLLKFLTVKNAPSGKEVVAGIVKETSKPYWHDKSAPPPRTLPPLAPEPETIIPDEVLERFWEVPDRVMQWLRHARRLTDKSIQRWELGWHAKARRVSIPIRDDNHNLVGISGRASPLPEDEGLKPKYLHSAGFKTANHLYGEDKARTNARVYLVEGFFDVIYLTQRGYNAVAICGSFISALQIEKLKRFSRVTLVLDGDKAGREATERALRALSKVMRTDAINLPEGVDPDELSDGELVEFLGPPND